jgi:hypothetical protein
MSSFEKKVAAELVKVARDVAASDDTNPKYMFQTFHTKLVLAIAEGRLDAQEYAKREMASRGLGKSGKWVGFDQAAKEWKVKS